MKIEFNLPDLPKLPLKFNVPLIFSVFVALAAFMVVVVWLSGYALLSWVLVVIGCIGLFIYVLMPTKHPAIWYERMFFLVLVILTAGGVGTGIILSSGWNSLFEVLAGVAALFAIGFAFWYQRRDKIKP